MTKSIFIVLLLVSVTAFYNNAIVQQPKTESYNIDQNNNSLPVTDTIISYSDITIYPNVLQNISNSRSDLARLVTNDSLFNYIKNKLVIYLSDSVFPYWYGTLWDFNGHTNSPQDGYIACGYFVSTTLKHIGFNLNRYKIAQQAAATITCSLCPDDQIQRFSSFNNIYMFLLNSEDAIYIIGLDYHTGFVLVQDGLPWFIHSDYISGNTIKELVVDSPAFSSNYYIIGRLDNDSTIKKWLNNEPFNITVCK